MLPELEKLYQNNKYKSISIVLNGTEIANARYGMKYGYRYSYQYGYGSGYSYGQQWADIEKGVRYKLAWRS